MSRRALGLLLVLVTALLAPGCGGLDMSGLLRSTQPGGRRPVPEVRVADVRLSHAPSNEQLGQYLCTRRLPGPLCAAFGPQPTPEQLRFAFDVELSIHNPARVPMPVVQALFGFTAYPEAEAEQNLGALCLSFCEDPEDCAQDASSACRSDEPEIRDLDDFARASTGFLISTALGRRRFEDLRVRTIPAGETIHTVVRLELEPEQMLRLVEGATRDAVDAIRTGGQPRFVIPYRLEGSVWVTVEGFGRLAAGFGPVSGEWDLGDALDSAAGS